MTDGVASAAPKTAMVPLPARRGVVPFIVGAMAVVPLALAAAGPVVGALACVGVVVVGASLWGRPRTTTVRVVVDAVELQDGRRLPRGRGEIVLERWSRWVESNKGGGRWVVRWRVRYVDGPSSPTIVADTTDLLGARAAAEALARAGGWPMRTRTDDEPVGELRAAADLDASLADRARSDPHALVAYARPARAEHVVEPLDEGVVARRPLDVDTVRALVKVAGALGAVGMLLGVVDGCDVSRGAVSALLLGGAPLAATLAWAAWRTLLPVEVVATRAGIEVRRRLGGRVVVARALLPARAIESAYAVSSPPSLLLVGDRFVRRIRTRSVAEAAWLRGAVMGAVAGATPRSSSALTWRGSPAAPRPATTTPAAAGSSPASTTDDGDRPRDACPRCAEPLARVGGPLDESACAACRGRFVSTIGVERLVEGEIGVSRDLLRELVGRAGRGPCFCPSCGTRMAPVRLKGADVDLCRGCGGLWLDVDELRAISAGRYDG